MWGARRMPGNSGRKTFVGICGFAESQERIFRDFDVLEVQQTFYQPPAPATAERWKAKAPPSFVFTLKAWQLITHEASSPTYRRLKEELPSGSLAQAGGFRSNDVTRMAWERTLEIAEALDAWGIVFQTPRSFGPTAENLRRIRKFFQAIDRRGRRMVFEPRGEAWTDRIVAPLVEELGLVHCVDPFLREPVEGPGPSVRYYRLHGLPAYAYHYAYTERDLEFLQGRLTREEANFVLFNNDSMARDARRFLALIRGSSLEGSTKGRRKTR
jgi:uncharacterized protein YecE (DUF72 family)